MYGGTVKVAHLRLAELRKRVSDLKLEELVIGDGLARVEELPFEAPWMGGLGSCLINILDIRRNETGEIEFQLGDENHKPYEDKGDTVWCKANDFYSEWPK